MSWSGSRYISAATVVDLFTELHKYADDLGMARVSQPQLAASMGLSVRTIVTAMQELQKLGAVEKRGYGWYQIRVTMAQLVTSMTDSSVSYVTNQDTDRTRIGHDLPLDGPPSPSPDPSLIPPYNPPPELLAALSLVSEKLERVSLKLGEVIALLAGDSDRGGGSGGNPISTGVQHDEEHRDADSAQATSSPVPGGGGPAAEGLAYSSWSEYMREEGHKFYDTEGEDDGGHDEAAPGGGLADDDPDRGAPRAPAQGAEHDQSAHDRLHEEPGRDDGAPAPVDQSPDTVRLLADDRGHRPRAALPRGDHFALGSSVRGVRSPTHIPPPLTEVRGSRWTTAPFTGTLEMETGMGVTKRPQKPAPEEYEIAPWHFAFADRMGLEVADMMYETEQFLDHHRAKGSRFADWDAAWRTWMRNTQKYGTRQKARPAGWRAQAMQQSFQAMDRFVERMRQEGHDVGDESLAAKYALGNNPTAYNGGLPAKAQGDGRLLAG